MRVVFLLRGRDEVLLPGAVCLRGACVGGGVSNSLWQIESPICLVLSPSGKKKVGPEKEIKERGEGRGGGPCMQQKWIASRVRGREQSVPNHPSRWRGGAGAPHSTADGKSFSFLENISSNQSRKHPEISLLLP